MIRFHAPDIASTHTLPQSDSQHCARVLRKQPGDIIEVTDGLGNIYTCTIIDPHPKHTLVDIMSCRTQPPVWDFALTVAVAPTKHIDRMEWLVEKLVETGVNRIIPVLCHRSERREIKTERIEKIAVSAMKQSLKAVCPEISPMTPLPLLVNEFRHSEMQRFVGYCDDSVGRRLLSHAAIPDTDTLLLIGPEGDFSHDEITMLTDEGFAPITLGDNRLRTETAALTGAITMHIINQVKCRE